VHQPGIDGLASKGDLRRWLVDQIQQHGLLNFRRISGKAPPSKLALPSGIARASGDLALTTVDQDIAGLSLTTTGVGVSLAIGFFDIDVSVAGVGICSGKLNAGTTFGAVAEFSPVTTGRATVGQVWIVAHGKGQVIKLQASKSINAGTATAKQTHSSLFVVQYG
jgi:hypothetical protein